MTGRITDIERYAINDGYGVRTTVFLKGCPLRCRWCSNPETQEVYPEMVFFKDKCIGCGTCRDTCPYGALKQEDLGDRKPCQACFEREERFACTRQCCTKCRKIVGTDYTVQQVLDEVKKDMSFYLKSGGGVTISGGEPFMQPDFLCKLLAELKNNWIHTAIESCGMADKADLEKASPYLDFVFMDIKHTDPHKHKAFTGVDNTRILDNILEMDRLSGKFGFPLMIRTPVIAGFNDTEEEIRSISRFVSGQLKNYKGMELLPYHKLGRGKYVSLGRKYAMADTAAISDHKIMELNQILYEQKIPVYKF